MRILRLIERLFDACMTYELTTWDDATVQRVTRTKAQASRPASDAGNALPDAFVRGNRAPDATGTSLTRQDAWDVQARQVTR